MTPNEFCKYIVEGKIYYEIESGDSDHAEQGRYIWPDRYKRLVELAREALESDT